MLNINRQFRVWGFLLVIAMMCLAVAYNNLEESYQAVNDSLNQLQKTHQDFCQDYPEFLASESALPKALSEQAQEPLKTLCNIDTQELIYDEMVTKAFTEAMNQYQKKLNLMWEKAGESYESIESETLKEKLSDNRVRQHHFYLKVYVLQSAVNDYHKQLENPLKSLTNFLFYRYEPVYALEINQSAIKPSF